MQGKLVWLIAFYAKDSTLFKAIIFSLSAILPPLFIRLALWLSIGFCRASCIEARAFLVFVIVVSLFARYLSVL